MMTSDDERDKSTGQPAGTIEPLGRRGGYDTPSQLGIIAAKVNEVIDRLERLITSHNETVSVTSKKINELIECAGKTETYVAALTERLDTLVAAHGVTPLSPEQLKAVTEPVACWLAGCTAGYNHEGDHAWPEQPEYAPDPNVVDWALYYDGKGGDVGDAWRRGVAEGRRLTATTGDAPADVPGWSGYDSNYPGDARGYVDGYRDGLAGYERWQARAREAEAEVAHLTAERDSAWAKYKDYKGRWGEAWAEVERLTAERDDLKGLLAEWKDDTAAFKRGYSQGLEQATETNAAAVTAAYERGRRESSWRLSADELNKLADAVKTTMDACEDECEKLNGKRWGYWAPSGWIHEQLDKVYRLLSSPPPAPTGSNPTVKPADLAHDWDGGHRCRACGAYGVDNAALKPCTAGSNLGEGAV